MCPHILSHRFRRSLGIIDFHRLVRRFGSGFALRVFNVHLNSCIVIFVSYLHIFRKVAQKSRERVFF